MHFSKNIILPPSTSCKHWSRNHMKWLKRLLKMYLRIPFCFHIRFVTLHFGQKSQNHCRLADIHLNLAFTHCSQDPTALLLGEYKGRCKLYTYIWNQINRELKGLCGEGVYFSRSPPLPPFYTLKVHKNGNFFGSDFEFCTFSLLVMLKY